MGAVYHTLLSVSILRVILLLAFHLTRFRVYSFFAQSIFQTNYRIPLEIRPKNRIRIAKKAILILKMFNVYLTSRQIEVFTGFP